MVEDEEKKEETEGEDSIWKSIVEEVKKEGRPVKEESIEVLEERPEEGKSLSEKSIEKVSGEPTPKYDTKKPEPIEKPSIEESIEAVPEERLKSIEKPEEKVLEKEEPKEMGPKKVVTRPAESKFTTIMVTKELKEILAKEKSPKESYGELIKRLLEKK